MLSVRCPKCNARLRIEEKYAGQSGICNKCKSSLVVPFGRKNLDTKPPTAKKRRAATILAAIFVVFAVVTLPHFAGYFYRAGVGHEFGVIRDAENLPWATMSDAKRAPYQARVRVAGFKCAVLMVFGQHIPGYLFVLITIGLLTRSISRSFRVFLRFTFFGVWAFGMFFLALGSSYWGPALPFPQSLAPAFILYLVAATFFGIILSLFWAFRKSKSWIKNEFREVLEDAHAE